MSRKIAATLLSSTICALAGCALQVPNIGAHGESGLRESFAEIDLINHVKCEILLGTRNALRVFKPGGPTRGNGVEWLRDWQAKISYKLVVDDSNSLNPGATYKKQLENAISHLRSGNVPVGQSFSASFGLVASAQSTRDETLAVTYKISDLLDYDPLPKDAVNCNKVGKTRIISNLKIDDFIVAKSAVAASPDTIPNNGKLSPFNVFQYHSAFIVIYGANATPIWNLIDITSNSSSPLINVSRKRTQDITVTLVLIDDKDVLAVYQASLIGQEVGARLRSGF